MVKYNSECPVEKSIKQLNKDKLRINQKWCETLNNLVKLQRDHNVLLKNYQVLECIVKRSNNTLLNDECSICKDNFDNLAPLKCRHATCIPCLIQLKKSLQDKPMYCPVCRQEIADFSVDNILAYLNSLKDKCIENYNNIILL